MRVLLVFVCAVAFAATSPLPQVQKAHLLGQVTDATNTVIPRAAVLLHWDVSGSKNPKFNNVGLEQDLWIKTDDTGTFAADIPPGFYDIFVSSSGFTPQCRKFQLKKDGSQRLDFKLQMDPVTAEAWKMVIVD